MRVTSRHWVCAVTLLLLVLSACTKPSPPGLPEGVVRVDNTDRSGPCRITVTNGTPKSHSLRVVYADGKVLLDVDVPSRSKRAPPVWHTFGADVAGQRLTVSLDGKTKEVVVEKDTVEIVIDAGEPLTAANAVTQSPQRLGWK